MEKEGVPTSGVTEQSWGGVRRELIDIVGTRGWKRPVGIIVCWGHRSKGKSQKRQGGKGRRLARSVPRAQCSLFLYYWKFTVNFQIPGKSAPTGAQLSLRLLTIILILTQQ
mgnify:CR=1 FL=1